MSKPSKEALDWAYECDVPDSEAIYNEIARVIDLVLTEERGGPLTGSYIL